MILVQLASIGVMQINISLCKREQTWEEWATLSDLNDDKNKTAGPVCLFLRVEIFTSVWNSWKGGRLDFQGWIISLKKNKKKTHLKEYQAPAPDTLNTFFFFGDGKSKASVQKQEMSAILPFSGTTPRHLSLWKPFTCPFSRPRAS